MEQWHCLYTKPRAEKQVATALQNLDLQTYLPLIKSVVAGQEPIEKPFFPCYLFLKADFHTVSLSAIQWTSGLRRIISYNSDYAPLSTELIELIQQKVQRFADRPQLLCRFTPGEKVRITTGPLQGLVAIFDQPLNDQQRVQVLLHILGQANRVKVDVQHLEKTSESLADLRPERTRRTRGGGRRIARVQH
jgi:transcriptional antiterminator RfaH